jgi:hypothetical protein
MVSPGLNGINWTLNEKGLTPYQAYENLMLNSSRSVSERISNLEDYWSRSEGVLLNDQGVGALFFAPEARTDAISFLLAQHAAGHGLIFSFSTHFIDHCAAPAPSPTGWRERNEPAFLHDLRISPWPSSTPNPILAQTLQGDLYSEL